MAVAPVNKFISIVVPVAPGEQKLYEVPTGTSSILLYAQVAHVGAATTYPKVTLIQRRESRSTGNKRDIRIVKDIEVIPNDALILTEGRIILEKTATTLDRLYITATQSGIGTIFGVTYDEPSGIATFTTQNAHGFSVGDPITMAGIAFTCPSNSGITTTIFPDPQRSYVVDTVPSTTTFSAALGSANGITHTYQSARHSFVRARAGAVNVVDGSIGGAANGTQYTPTAATYEGDTGVLELTVAGHALGNGDTISLDDESLIFTCTSDNNATEHAYPRSTDPASTSNSLLNNGVLSVTFINANQFSVNVGLSTASGYVGPLQMEFTGSILENSTA